MYIKPFTFMPMLCRWCSWAPVGVVIGFTGGSWCLLVNLGIPRFGGETPYHLHLHLVLSMGTL